MNDSLIESLDQYKSKYQKSIENPEEFWGEIADDFTWFEKWNNILDYDMLNADFKWFKGAKTNISFNCLDRHLESRGNDTAIIFEPNNPKEGAQHISYKDLHERVCIMSNVLILSLIHI